MIIKLVTTKTKNKNKLKQLIHLKISVKLNYYSTNKMIKTAKIKKKFFK
jgi:hypothetical protein